VGLNLVLKVIESVEVAGGSSRVRLLPAQQEMTLTG